MRSFVAIRVRIILMNAALSPLHPIATLGCQIESSALLSVLLEAALRITLEECSAKWAPLCRTKGTARDLSLSLSLTLSSL